MDEKPPIKKIGVSGGKKGMPIDAPVVEDVDLSEIVNVDEAAAPAPVIGDVSLDQMLSAEANVEDAATIKKKKQNKIVFGGVAAGVVVLLLLFLSAQGGSDGPETYGICSTYLEMNTPYPHTLEYTDLEGSATAIRIYFNHIDPFGEQKNEMIECTFAPDEKQGMKIVKIQRNRRPINIAEVQKFNKLLPVIAKTEMNLAMPPHWKNPLVKD